MFGRNRGMVLSLVVTGTVVCFLFGCDVRRVAAEEKTVDVQGVYRSGQSDVRITKNGEVYQIRWDFPDGSRWIGVGLVSGDTLSFGWDLPRGGNLGICVYKIEKGDKGPKLVGHWAAYQDKKPTADTLTFVSK